MLEKITRDNPIFKSADFLKDAIAFNIMVSIVENVEKYPVAKAFSNHKDCIVVNSDNAHPVMVWTADDFADFESVYDFILQEFADNKPLQIMSKMSFYEALKDKQLKIFHRLGAYHCDKLNPITYVGKPDNISSDEVEMIADMLRDFGHETMADLTATHESCLPTAQKFVDNPLYLVWRDTNNKIVTTCRMAETENHARAGHVMTLPEERGKSYAKMLLHYLTKQILDMGKMPVLYTNFDYESSNICYSKVGYTLDCVIVQCDVVR